MIQRRLVSMFLSVALLASVPAGAAAQPDAVGPEGTDWALTGYLVDDEIAGVPIGVDVTLLLEAGVASGSGGCNTFSGGYLIEGTSLTFDAGLTRTLRACAGAAQDVEDTYLSSLTEVAGWEVSGAELELSDTFGEVVLTFAAPGATLTPGQLLNLLARLDAMEVEIDALDQRIDNISIARLRERIKNLEADNQDLKKQIGDLGRVPGTSSGSAFNAAEKVLLEGIPTRISSRCSPLRERLPVGAVAAVQCSPSTTHVTEMAYYLMGKSGALSLFDSRMEAHGLEGTSDIEPPGTTGCWEGNPGYSFPGGGYIGGIGCYIENGRANLRIVQESTKCKQLRVGGKLLKRPVTYIAMTGPDRDIQRIYDWAMRSKPNNLASGLTVPIERPGARRSPNCSS